MATLNNTAVLLYIWEISKDSLLKHVLIFKFNDAQTELGTAERQGQVCHKTTYSKLQCINLFFYLLCHCQKCILPFISQVCMELKHHCFQLWFYIFILNFVGYLHSTEVHQDKFNMLYNPSSFAPSCSMGI